MRLDKEQAGAKRQLVPYSNISLSLSPASLATPLLIVDSDALTACLLVPNSGEGGIGDPFKFNLKKIYI